MRTWEIEEHLRHISEGGWGPMFDDQRQTLIGIEGKKGVRSRKDDGTFIGCDFIKMQPGSNFPLHVHGGDHIISFFWGKGFVHINGQDIPVCDGHVIHIPAEYPHGVWVPENATEPLVFVATGHPHQHVDSPKRSRSVPDEKEPGPGHHET